MEDYEEQEVEFWAKLAEEDISRGTMLRRSAAAAFGLTVLGGSSSALAATRARSAARRRLSARLAIWRRRSRTRRRKVT